MTPSRINFFLAPLACEGKPFTHFIRFKACCGPENDGRMKKFSRKNIDSLEYRELDLVLQYLLAYICSEK
jgi:hypothetical protein